MAADEYDDESAPEDNWTPRSRRRTRVQIYSAVAFRLVELDAKKLKVVPVPEHIAPELAAARKATSHGARRRQTLFLAKLLRDYDIAPIVTALDRVDPPPKKKELVPDKDDRYERFVNRLVNEGDAAVRELVAAFPGLDGKQLALLTAEAKLDGKGRRVLEKFLRRAGL